MFNLLKINLQSEFSSKAVHVLVSRKIWSVTVSLFLGIRYVVLVQQQAEVLADFLLSCQIKPQLLICIIFKAIILGIRIYSK